MRRAPAVGEPQEGVDEPPRVDPALVKPSGMTLRDLVNEAVAGLFARPGRTVLTVLGTVIGLAALVATLGLSRTAGNRIVGRFDELAALLRGQARDDANGRYIRPLGQTEMALQIAFADCLSRQIFDTKTVGDRGIGLGIPFVKIDAV